MDTVTVIRTAAGLLFAAVLMVLIMRRRKTA
jgi:LPXTG-motif cell wall-anchored protein